MIKYFCDKCGKEVGEFEAYTVSVKAPEIKSWADQYMYEQRGYQVCRDCMAKVAEFIEPKLRKKFEDEPQTDCGDFADRLAYERGVKHAWEVAQKVFDSTVAFYEAEDFAKHKE